MSYDVVGNEKYKEGFVFSLNRQKIYFYSIIFFGDNLYYGDNLRRWQIAEVINIRGDKYPWWQIKWWQKVVWSEFRPVDACPILIRFKPSLGISPHHGAEIHGPKIPGPRFYGPKFYGQKITHSSFSFIPTHAHFQFLLTCINLSQRPESDCNTWCVCEHILF